MSLPAAVYGGDFETDNDRKRAWIAQWSISDGSKEVTGRDLESFASHLLVLMQKGQEVFLYFHNLKYDVEFMKYALKEICEENEFEMHIMMRDKNPIFIRIEPPKDSRFSPLNIRDSMKKIPSSLKDLGAMFGLEKLEGFEFEPGWSAKVDFNDDSNWDYVRMDSRIVAVAMNWMHENGYNRSTFSGDAWNEAKKLLNQDKDGKPYPKSFKWDKYFPSLEYELDLKLRKGYTGGINISRHRGFHEGVEITHADVNSMYPTVMYYDPLPYDKPTYLEREPREGSLYIVHAFIKLKLRPGKIPWFTFKSGYDNKLEGLSVGEPIVETKEWHEVTLTSVDLNLLREWYEVVFDDTFPPEWWVFKQKTGIFREYIDKYIAQKKAAKKGTIEYHWAKFMMNSLYGRFGLSPESQETQLVDLDDDLVWKRSKKISDKIDAYLPYAMFITAHARRRLMDYCMKCGPENVIHCDTDSVIHFGGPVEGIEYGDELGQWSIEEKPLKMWEGGFKRYIEQVEENVKSRKSYNIACAGVSEKMRVELYDNPDKILSNDVLGKQDYKVTTPWLRETLIKEGKDPDHYNSMKLIPVRVPGGVILTERQHKLCDNVQYRIRFT